MKSKPKRAPYWWYYTPYCFFTLAGLVLSCYLAWTHYQNYTSIAYTSFCAISQTINCDTVAQSPWSVIAGLPVAVWGIFSYFFLVVLLLPLAKQNDIFLPLWRLHFHLNLLFSLASLFLAYISITQINSLCILCLGTYAVNFILLFYSWLICKRFEVPFVSHPQEIVSITKQSVRLYLPLTIFIAFALLTKFTLPVYWHLETTTFPDNIASGTTKTGHPWIGAENPKLTIEEFSDYQCFQCYKMQHAIRQLIEKHPDKIRLIHHHYPLDHDFNPIVVPSPFHVGSGKMALLAIYAMNKGNFWEMNDALFLLGRSKRPFNIKYLAEQTKLPVHELSVALTHPDIKKLLYYDIRLGMKKRITSTPSFLINDKIYTGFIPPEIINEAIR